VKYEDLTREERVELMRTDIKAYLALLEEDHLLMLLDGISKSGGLDETRE